MRQTLSGNGKCQKDNYLEDMEKNQQGLQELLKENDQETQF